MYKIKIEKAVNTLSCERDQLPKKAGRGRATLGKKAPGHFGPHSVWAIGKSHVWEEEDTEKSHDLGGKGKKKRTRCYLPLAA